MKIKKIYPRLVAAVMALLFSWPCAVRAETVVPPYETLYAAREQTHRDGPFRLRGNETSVLEEQVQGKTEKKNRYYYISGYDLNGSETYMQLESRLPGAKPGELVGGAWSTRDAFLLTLEKIYIKTSESSAVWAERDITALLPKFVSLGTMDQFFMLELLNSDRLPLYKDYLSKGGDEAIGGKHYTTVKADVSREQFAGLAEALTQDVKALLGPAADGMTETQLTLLRSFARGMLANLDAEAHFIFYISQEDGRIVRIDTRMDMANPYGSRAPGATSRVRSESTMLLYDFGSEITRVIP